MAKPKSPGTRDPSWYNDLPEGSKPKQANAFERASFVRCELNDAQKDHLKSQQYTWDDVNEHIEALVELRYKLSVSKDEYNTSYAVWLTPQNPADPNHGLILSGRGPSCCAAFAVAFYKHFTILDGVWPHGDSAKSRDQWG